MVALVMFAAAEAQRGEEHIGVEELVNWLGGRSRVAARLFGVLSVDAVAAIPLRQGIETVLFSRMIGIATNIEAVPLWWVHLHIPLGAALLLIVSVAQFLVLVAGGEPRGAAAKPGPDAAE